MGIFDVQGQLADAQVMGATVLHHLARIDQTLEQILAGTSQRDPESWTQGEGGQAPGGAAFTLGPTFIPIGKRLILQRVSSTAPAGAGPLAIYAATGGVNILDGNELREVIAIPQLYADQVANGTVIRGGMSLVARFTTLPAGVATCTIRYEGLLYDDTLNGDI